MASTYVTYTAGNLPTMTKFTFSIWTKRSQLGANQRMLEARVNGTNLSTMYMQSDDKFAVYQEAGGVTKCDIKTDMKLRDVSGWYHICVAVDTTLASINDRVKIYINGVDEGYTGTGQVQNEEHNYCRSNCATVLGTDDNGSGTQFYSGSMGFAIICVGTAYAATDFGEFDSNGVWTIKTSPSVTYGTDGFFILKNGNSVTDQSGEGNDFTVGAGNLTNNEDSPSNVFATFNPLSPNDANGNFTNCNTANNTGASSWRTMFSTLGAGTGKFYCEMKYVSGSNQMFGIISLDKKNDTKNIGYVGDSNCGTQAVGLAKGGDYYINGSDTTYTGGSNTSWTTGDIISIAMDRTNSKVYFGKNGTWMGSGDPTSGSTGTGAISFSPDTGSSWGFATSVYASTSATNFGNGYFQTTAISSAGTNASNNGVFEYDVPTGYTALCTKGLNGE